MHAQTTDLDLDDVNNLMMVLEKLRRMEAKIFLKLSPIQETYSLLKHFHVRVAIEETEELDQLEQKWDKLKAQSTKTMDVLRTIAPSMRGRLASDIEEFKREVKRFKSEVHTTRSPSCTPFPPLTNAQFFHAAVR
jgi:dynein heavy chain